MSALTDFRAQAYSLLTQGAYWRWVNSGAAASVSHSWLLDSSFTTDTKGPQDGGTGLQLRVWCAGFDTDSDSNAIYPLAGLEAEIIRHIQSPEDEEQYAIEMLDQQAFITDPTKWRALASVFAIDTAPAIGSAPERNGSLLTYELSITCQLVAG